MISLFCGTPGSGKSLHIAERITALCNQRKECIVIANFEVDVSNFRYAWRFHYIDNLALNPDKLRTISDSFFENKKRQEDKIFLFIDECQLIFNSRDWQSKSRMDWLSFFSQHRKYGFNVVLVAQFDLMIDKQIRSLIEYQYIHRKISNFGYIGKLIKLLSFGDWFICIELWYPIGQKTSSYIFRAHKRYYKIYDTFNDFALVKN